MITLTTIGGSVLSGIINLVINRIYDKAHDYWMVSQSDVSCALQKLQITLSITKGMVVHVENKAYYNDDIGIRTWVSSIQDATYNVNDLLDEIEYEQLKKKFKKPNKMTGCFHKYTPVKVFEHDIIVKVKEIQEMFNYILQMATYYNLEVVVDGLRSSMDYAYSQRRRTSSFLDNDVGVFGRDGIRDEVVRLLIQHNPTTTNENDIEPNAKKIPLLCIVGMGGIGKTTLAQMVVNDEDVKKKFGLTIWVCVSDDFDERKIIIQILESVYYDKRKKINEEEKKPELKSSEATHVKHDSFDVLKRNLEHELMGKTFLLVLDDVWNENPAKWKMIENCLSGDNGSKILITTRSKTVGRAMSCSKVIELDGIGDGDFWSLFKKCSFGTIEEQPPELEAIAKDIMKKLKGSPLAAKTVGRILRSNISERHWKSILDSDIWMLRQNEYEILPSLRLSYHHLPEPLKPCFGFCSLYPKDYIYEKKEIVSMWIALGYIQNQHRGVSLEETGEDYINDLMDRSMFESCTVDDIQHIRWHFISLDATGYFKMHDLVHDLSKMISKQELFMAHDSYTFERVPSSTRHLSILIDGENWNWKWNNDRRFDHLKNIRTLVFLSKWKMSRLIYLGNTDDIYVFLEKAASKMELLRILDLSYTGIEKLPLFKAKHLRYLNLLGTDVKKLPIGMEDVYQIQVLKCDRGQQVFRQIRFMENLRHISGIRVDRNIVPNLENFHCLQELELELAVPKKYKLFPTKEREKGHHKLKALRGMKWMRELCIRGLENVESKEEAVEAELKSMDRLTELRLRWDPLIPIVGNVEEILVALHPGPNIRVLEINYFEN